jgi:hypothetical protein
METTARQAQDVATRNTKIVQEMYAAFKAGDIQSLLNRVSEDIDWMIQGPTEISPLMGTRRGRDQVAEFFRKIDEVEEVQLFEPRDYIAQDDKVAVFGHYKARVKATNRIAESDFVHLFVLQDGKVVKFRELFDTAAALVAHKNVTL